MVRLVFLSEGINNYEEGCRQGEKRKKAQQAGDWYHGRG
jgi:hypothetical protein